MTKQITSIKVLMLDDNIQRRFSEILGQKAQAFISSVLQVVKNNDLLSQAEPQTVLNAASTAAILDLPINKNLGFAWIVPYKNRSTKKQEAQFQMGWKGYVQLCQRTGQYKRINVVAVYENQFESFNTLTEELKADFSKEGEGSVIGYAAYFQLINGFEKLVFWTKEKVKAHAKRFSKTYGRGNSPWTNFFDEMAMKTVLKNAISKWGIMSIEIQTAVIADQAVQRDSEKYIYPDNGSKTMDEIDHQKEYERILFHIDNSKTIEQLKKVSAFVGDYDLIDHYNKKLKSLEDEKG
jgi:recombination protein RecT